MPGWLNTILSIILFIFCLSTLIIVHEAGHLAAAKIFNVYCDDFSIGFGKAFFHKRRKNGETSFSLRILPFGGYVAMAAEEGEIREGVNVPKERTIAGTKKWKAAIIMSAGVIVNFIVAIILLYISNQAFITQQLVGYGFDIKPDSLAAQAGLKTFNNETNEGTLINLYGDTREKAQAIGYYSFDSKAYFDGMSEPISVLAAINTQSVTFNDRELGNKLRFYQPIEFATENKIKDDQGNEKTIKQVYNVANFEEEVTPETIIDGHKLNHIDLHLHAFEFINDENLKPEEHIYCSSCGREITKDELLVIEPKNENEHPQYFHKNCEHPYVKHSELGNLGMISLGVKDSHVTPIKLEVKTLQDNKLAFDTNIGLSMYKAQHWQCFTEAWTNTFKQFGAGSSMIFTTLGNLFIGKGWDNVGSIVSIYTQQTQLMNGFGPSMLFYYYGLISVNLAIFNLLPFPGLDGWQLLVIGIEGITRKKIPDKVKTIVSYIGLGLLFILMIVLLVKDFIMIF